MQLKRFIVSDRGVRSRLNTFADVPLGDVDFSPYFAPDSPFRDQDNRYRLYAVSNHTGDAEGGHYFAYCRPNDGVQWVEFNDHDVSEDVEPVITKAAYILFFRRVSDTPRTLENLKLMDIRCGDVAGMSARNAVPYETMPQVKLDGGHDAVGLRCTVSSYDGELSLKECLAMESIAFSDDHEPMVATSTPAAKKEAEPKAKPADDGDGDFAFMDIDPKKAALKPNAAKEGGAAVAKAAPKKAPAKAKAKEESPVAVCERPARARKPVTYKFGSSDDDMKEDDDSFHADDSDEDFE